MSTFYLRGMTTTLKPSAAAYRDLEQAKIDMGLVDVVAGDPTQKTVASAQKPNILRRGTGT